MVVTLYTKPGCHLCETARALLDELAPERGFTLHEVDIAGDATLFARYRYDIPVVMIDGREVARGRIDERALTLAILKGENEERDLQRQRAAHGD